MCENGCVSEILLVCEAYEELLKAKSKEAQAVLTCVNPPDDKQLEKIRQFVCKNKEPIPLR